MCSRSAEKWTSVSPCLEPLLGHLEVGHLVGFTLEHMRRVEAVIAVYDGGEGGSGGGDERGGRASGYLAAGAYTRSLFGST